MSTIEPPENFNHNGSSQPQPNSLPGASDLPQPQPNPPNEAETLPPRATTAQTRVQRLYLILLVIGLSIGALVSVGVVIALNQLGLTNPPQVDRVDE